MSRDSVYWTYRDEMSVYENAWYDMMIGLNNRIVGTNATSGPQIHPGSYIVNTNKQRTFIIIYEMLREASPEEAKIWSQSPNGRRWKYNYKVEPLTKLVPITEEMIKFIESHVDTSKFFNQVRHGKKGEGHNDIVECLIDFINQKS